jgi:restriction system protein
MGAFWMSVMEYAGFLSEFVGYKAGLALTRQEIHEHFKTMPGYDGFVAKRAETGKRFRSEEVQFATGWLLYKVGHIEMPSDGVVMTDLYHKYKKDPEELEKFWSICKPFPDFLKAGLAECDRTGNKSIDPEPFLLDAFEREGELGAFMAWELICSLNRALVSNPWSKIRLVDWADTKKLKELFKSESLNTTYGTFLDQRFIDYLSRNFEKIDSMNWRKFEGLTGEFFEREGYHVELGPGRADEGVDVRVWPKKAGKDKPPLILIQCKRQKETISKVIVKSLYADVQHEKAKSGLIVTTSRLSPGADETRKARGYPIDAADRATLAKWLAQMRTPGTGVFLGE